MWFRSLFDTLLARSPHTLSRKSCLAPSFRRRLRSCRPLLETLEDRTLLSTYVVNSFTDTGTGSGLNGDIRYCITQADESANTGSTITFDTALTGSTITLTHGELVISDTMTITGPGSSLTITENTYSRLFDVAFGGSLTLEQLTLSGGFANGSNGGAIFSSGTLALSGVTVTGNEALGLNGAPGQPGVAGGNGGDAYGGGIYVGEGSVTLSNDTFSSNNAVGGQGGGGSGPYTGSGAGNGGNGGGGSGGGLYVAAGSVTLTNDTFSGNNAVGGNGGNGGGGGRTGYGNNTGFGGNGGNGGVGSGGGLYASTGSVTLNDVTLSSNNAGGGNGGAGGSGLAGGSVGIGGPAIGGGMDVGSYSNVLMYDTLVAANLAGGNPSDIQGSLNTASSYNLIGDGSGGISAVNHNLLGSSASPLNPLLAPLGNYGGPTQTIALLPGSPALNAGDITNAPAYDQRGPGFPRIVNGTIDIGAFEFQNGSPRQSISLTVAGFPSSIAAGTAVNFTVTVHDADGSTDTSYTGTEYFTSSDGQAGLPADYTFTAADAGVHTFSATLKTASTQWITVSDASAGVSASENGIVVSPAVANTLTVSGFPSPVTAGQAGTFTLTAVDPYGNTATGYTGTVQFTSSDAKASPAANYTFQAGDAGVHTFSATLKTAGTQSITATDTATGSVIGSDTGIAVNPAAPSKIFVAGFPSPTTAGVAGTFTVTLEDAYGNVATAYSGTVHFASSDGKAVLPANYTFQASDQGVHSFRATLKTPGTQSITAQDSSAGLSGSDTAITVNPAAASKFIITAPASVKAGVAFRLTLTVEDAYGNVVTGYAGTVHFTSTYTTATLPKNYTFTAADKGVHTFTSLVLRKKGYQKITIMDMLNSSLFTSVIVDVL